MEFKFIIGDNMQNFDILGNNVKKKVLICENKNVILGELISIEDFKGIIIYKIRMNDGSMVGFLPEEVACDFGSYNEIFSNNKNLFFSNEVGLC